MHPTKECPEDVARILGDEERAADARADIGAVHALDAEDVVVATHEVGAQAEVQGGARMRLPVVLHVKRDVTIASGRGLHFEWRLIPPVIRPHASGDVVRIALHDSLEREAIVQGAVEHVAAQAGCRPDAGLELVRPTPTLLVVGEIAAEHEHRRGLDGERLDAVHGHENPAARRHAAGDARRLVHLDRWPEPRIVRERVFLVAALVVVRRLERRLQTLTPDRIELGLIQRATGTARIQRLPVPLSIAREPVPIVLPEPRQLVRADGGCQLDERLPADRRVVERLERRARTRSDRADPVACG